MTDTVDKPQSLTPEIVKAELQLSLSKEGLAYQSILQECENIVFTNDNLNEEREKLTKLRIVKTKLEAMENPHTKAWSDWNKSRKTLVDPAAALLARKEAEFAKKAKENKDVADRIEAEKQRKAAVLSEIDNFFIAQSQAVANATTPEEIVKVEKLIGSHRRAFRYDGFYDLMDTKAANLTDLIKSQKEAIKKLQALKQAENAANEIGDDQAVLDSREAQEQITVKISENREVVQSEAINMASNSVVEEVEVIVPTAPKPRRQVWTWTVLDIKQTQKKMPDWVELFTNDTKIDEYLKAKKAEGIEGEEFEFAGIKFYLEKSY